MDIQSLLGGVALGKDTSGNFKLSMKGLAVRRPDGKFYVHEGQQMLDVNDLTLDGVDNYIYRLPVQSVKQGDLILTSDSPFSVLYVQDVSKDGPVIWLRERFQVDARSVLDEYGLGHPSSSRRRL